MAGLLDELVKNAEKAKKDNDKIRKERDELVELRLELEEKVEKVQREKAGGDDGPL